MSVLLRVEDLAVNYGHIEAVKGIGFQLNAGEITALVGANGRARAPHYWPSLDCCGPPGAGSCSRMRTSRGWRRMKSCAAAWCRWRRPGDPGTLTVSENLALGLYAA